MRITTTLALATLLAGTAAFADTTGVTGGGQPYNNYQPSLALTELFLEEGIYPSMTDGDFRDGAIDYSIGMIRNFAGNYAPGNWAADGHLLSTVANSGAYGVIGTRYGSTGLGNFAVPNLGGKTIIGAVSPDGQGAKANYGVAYDYGLGTPYLQEAQLPAHSHSLPGGGQTGVTGNGAPIDQREPSLTMIYLIDALGAPLGSGTGVAIGQVAAFAGDFVPQGWRPADGSLLNIADFGQLYGTIGTRYGGDGVTTFALPDLRGRTIVGAGSGGGLTPVTLGETFGSVSTTLTIGQMPAHDHSLPSGQTGMTGGNDPISNFQPSLGLNYLISLQGAFPLRDNGMSPEIPYIGEIIAYAGDVAPNGWAFADGSLLSIAQNTALFSILGTDFGGNGSYTFGLPDLRGRTIVGTGFNLGVGTQLGSEQLVLTADNLPPHAHDLIGGVPEPATWGLMLAGFGLTGTTLRRRQTVAA